MSRRSAAFLGILYLLSFSAIAQVPDSLLHITDDSARALAIGKLAANTATFERDFVAADHLLTQAKAVNTTLRSDYVQAQLLREAGLIEQARENNPAAIGYLQQAYNGFKKIGNSKAQADALIRLEQVYFDADELALAEKYALQALALHKQNPDLPLGMLGDCYNELSNIYGKGGNQPKSLAYINLARKTYQKAGEEQSVQTSIFNSAIILRKMGRLSESVQQFKEVEAYAKQKKNDYYLVFVYMNLPQTLIKMGKYPEALSSTNEAMKMVQSDSSLYEYSFLETIHTNFHKIYAAQNNYRQAYDHYQLAIQYGDSLTDLAKKKEIARLETQFETKHKEERIQELGTINTAKQQQVVVLVAFLLALLGFMAVFLWQYRRLKRSQAKISQQSEQMKLLMKELHHRVKNNLAIVSSLLKLQSNRIEEESAARAVREGQQRVEAMSLIHQRLYQTDLLTSINMKEYIVDLTENLMLAYGFDLDHFDLRLNVEKEELDVDLAIPVGLILNELLTNSFKYAYQNVGTPMLAISLTSAQGVTLEIRDNGPGIDETQWQQKDGSFGKRLIRNLSEQTGGKYQIGNENGTYYRLHIPDAALRRAA